MRKHNRSRNPDLLAESEHFAKECLFRHRALSKTSFGKENKHKKWWIIHTTNLLNFQY